MNLSDGFGEAEVAEAKRRFSEDRFVAIEKILGRTSPDGELRNDLAYLLWKTLRNTRAGNTNFNETLDVLARIQRKAAALASELAPILAHPGTNTAAADNAAFLLYLRAKQWESLEIEHLAELAASLSASAIEVLKKNRKKKGRPVDTMGYAALVAYLQGIELKYTGRNSRYTFNAYTEKFGGTFFLLLKTFLEAVAEELHEAPPSDAKMKGLLDRSCPPSNKRPPKKAWFYDLYRARLIPLSLMHAAAIR